VGVVEQDSHQAAAQDNLPVEDKQAVVDSQVGVDNCRVELVEAYCSFVAGLDCNRRTPGHMEAVVEGSLVVGGGILAAHRTVRLEEVVLAQAAQEVLGSRP
jgi:hypothetical protein